MAEIQSQKNCQGSQRRIQKLYAEAMKPRLKTATQSFQLGRNHKGMQMSVTSGGLSWTRQETFTYHKIRWIS